jgi:hypothetical protein
MISTAVNGLLVALLALLPTAAAKPRAHENPKDKDVVEEKVVALGDGEVFVDDGDVEVEGDDPIVVRIGRGGFLGVRLPGSRKTCGPTSGRRKTPASSWPDSRPTARRRAPASRSAT